MTLLVHIASAQEAQKGTLSRIITTVNRESVIRAMEKIYIQTDRSSYAAGDSLWFKSYLFEAGYFTASRKSDIIYIEIVNERESVIKRVMVPVTAGIGYGQLQLQEKDYLPGNYQLRAYTTWMLKDGLYATYRDRRENL